MLSSKDLSKFIRINSLKMTSSGGSSHIGSIFSIADILAVLYIDYLKYDVKNIKLHDRDRFILSKGHAGAGVYAALAGVNFINKDLLNSHYKNGSVLSGHVSHKGVPGVELSTGSLGHGLPVSIGMALAAKLNNSSHRIIVLLSDGECDEGSNWEAFLIAPHHKLNNLTAIIDYNKLQSLGTVSNTLELEPLSLKLTAFGWHVIEVDGHDHQQILSALNFNSVLKPKLIIAHTVKGKGVSFMENNVLWHYKTAKDNDFIAALHELEN